MQGDSNIFLCPSFQPPRPCALHGMSQHDFLAALLKSTIHGSDEIRPFHPIRKTKKRIMNHEDTISAIKQHSNHDARSQIDNSRLNVSDLFDGAVNFNYQEIDTTTQLVQSNANKKFSRHPLSGANNSDAVVISDCHGPRGSLNQAGHNQVVQANYTFNISNTTDAIPTTFTISNNCSALLKNVLHSNDMVHVTADLSSIVSNAKTTSSSYIQSSAATVPPVPSILLSSVLDGSQTKRSSTISRKQVNHSAPNSGSGAVATIQNTEYSGHEIYHANECNDYAERFTPEDFNDLQTFARNVGSSIKGFSLFVDKVRMSSGKLSMCIIWADLTTTHATSTHKYCTPSVNCNRWFCSCDRSARVKQAYKDVLATVVVFADEQEIAYFLPLLSAESTMSGAVTKNRVPLRCEVSLDDRWAIMKEIITESAEAKVRVVFYASLLWLTILAQESRFNSGSATDCGVHQPPKFPVTISAQNADLTTAITNRSNVGLKAGSNPYTGSGLFDPRIAAYLCRTDISETSLELSSLCELFNVPLEKYEGSSFCPLDYHSMGKVSKAVGTAFIELRCLLRLSSKLGVLLERADMTRVFVNIEMPLASILASMELTGVAVSLPQMDAAASAVRIALSGVEDRMMEASGRVINLASPEQVAGLLYDTLGLPQPPISRGNKRQRHASTSEEDLLRIRGLHPAVDLILSSRALSKYLSTYVDGLRPYLISVSPTALFSDIEKNKRHLDTEDTITPYEQIIAAQRQKLSRESTLSKTGSVVESRIHAWWNQTTVRTGRLSCSRPNLQSIPNTQVVCGQELNARALFTASKGYVLVGADYSQIEVRILAHLSGDPSLLELFRAQGDVYRNMAAVIFKRPIEAIHKAERDEAKTICLGVIYGMGVPAIAARLGIETPAANAVLHSFYDRFKEVQTWMQRVKYEAKSNGYVSTLCGRRRYLESLSSGDHGLRAQAERQAVNTVVQGSASDVIKLAMLLVDRNLSANLSIERSSQLPYPSPDLNRNCRLIMQIHDELIFEVQLSPSAVVAIDHCDELSNSLPPDYSYSGDPCVRRFASLLADCMERQVTQQLGLRVPITCNISVGSTWGNMKPYNQS